MAIQFAHGSTPATAADAVLALVAGEGTAAQGYPPRLGGRQCIVRDLADAVHLLCLLHGRHPGIIELAAAHAPNAEAEGWLAQAADAFPAERGLVTRLVAAAGPSPSTPGQAESEAVVHAQRHALDMLGRSDRIGCALGAAVAMVLDWRAIRLVLDGAAQRLGLALMPCSLPQADATVAMLATLAGQPGPERALTFGAQQLIAQHRGLWMLLEARAGARDTH